MTALARGGLALFATALILVGGCRTSTDRIRVLEAEKADAERQNMELRNQNADAAAKAIKEQSRAESEEARRRALQLELEMLKNKEDVAPEPGSDRTTVDAGKLKKYLGDGTEVIEREDGGVSIVLESDITFRAGRADLSRQAESTLGRVVLALKETDNLGAVRIEGHTDSDPIRKSGWADNKELSLARAKRVRMFLVSNGVEDGAMSVEGHGATRPVASNSSRTGKAKNRRVEIILLSR